MNNTICPNCEAKFDGYHYGKCENCKVDLVKCDNCNRFSEVKMIKTKEHPGGYSICQFCGQPAYYSFFVQKSSIYEHYYYAFKFVNRVRLPFGVYFGRDRPRTAMPNAANFPLGEIKKDLGDFINDFRYKEGSFWSTDWGTARAYELDVEIDGEIHNLVALSHESGIEIFLIAVGTFVGLETSKFVLKRVLEGIESKINNWWKKSDQKEHFDDKNAAHPLTFAIQVRTPNWELVIDGRFTKKERERILDIIEKHLPPSHDIEDLLKEIPNKKLVTKIRETIREIALKHPDDRPQITSVGHIHGLRKL